VISDETALLLFAGATASLITLALGVLWGRTVRVARLARWLAGVALGWAALGALVAIRWAAPLALGSPERHCAWCLLTARGQFAGYLLLAALAAVALEAPAAWLACRVGLRCPSLEREARRRTRQASIVVLGALLVLGGLAAALVSQHEPWCAESVNRSGIPPAPRRERAGGIPAVAQSTRWGLGPRAPGGAW
jgi:hypothetical protein